jgi:hypothetical protein
MGGIASPIYPDIPVVDLPQNHVPQMFFHHQNYICKNGTQVL